jgi:hypothetical protein
LFDKIGVGNVRVPSAEDARCWILIFEFDREDFRDKRILFDSVVDIGSGGGGGGRRF